MSYSVGYLQRAERLAQQSNCQKSKFGAVLVDTTGKIIGGGYNYSIVPNLCCMRSNTGHGCELERCGAVHAEQAAILHAAKERYNISGSTLWLWGDRYTGEGLYYCSLCGRVMYAAGVAFIGMSSRIISVQTAVEEAYRYILGAEFTAV